MKHSTTKHHVKHPEHHTEQTEHTHEVSKPTGPKKTNNTVIWVIVAILVIIGLYWVWASMKQPTTPDDTNPPVTGTGQTTVDFYVMSQCPYGVQVEDGIKPVLDKLGSSVKFSLNFIGNGDSKSTFQSLHGANEVNGD